MSKGTKEIGVNEKISTDDLVALQNMYQQTYERWLGASRLTETELLAFRVVDKFKVAKTTENNVVIVRMTYEDKEKKRQTIGEPIVIPKNNSEAMCDAIFLLLFISKKLDNANETDPIHGSHCNSYFHSRAVKFGKEQLDSR